MAGSPTMDQVKNLVALNAPVLYLHPHDIYMPCSAEFFMEHSDLLLGDTTAACQVSMAFSAHECFVKLP